MDHLKAPYAGFNTSDFINDPFFQDWVMRPTPEHELFWSTFLHANPGKQEEIGHAQDFLRNLSFQSQLPDETMISRSFENHMKRISGAAQEPLPAISPLRHFSSYWRVAAIFGGVALVLATLFVVFRSKENRQSVATNFGEIHSLLLPDSSQVVLNAHSSISFSNNWNGNSPREVWLQGEAYFLVKHLNKNARRVLRAEQFLVHLNGMDVAVLGTAFDIRQRRGKTEVVLQTGKIKLSFSDKTRPEIVMSPGDMVSYSNVENKLTRSTAIAENYIAWKEKKLLLNDPNVREILGYLEDNYGMHIRLEDESMGLRKIEGPLLLTNVDDVLFILTTVLKAELVKNKNTLVLRPIK